MINAKRLEYTKTRSIERVRVLQDRMSREFKLTLLISLAHLPLGLVLYNAGPLAIVHPIAAFVIGLYLAVQKRVRLERVAVAAAYFVASEVLWRMAQIPVFWEFGKYGSAFIMFAALVNRRLYVIPKLPLIYFIALIPACMLTLIEFDSTQARAHLSFNMSGPLLLLISCWFFSNIKLSSLPLRRLLLVTIFPLLSVGFVTFFYTVTNDNIEFNTESNIATSGGFGPNQVASMLGLGVLITVACFVIFKHHKKLKVFLGVAAIFFTAQSVFTFSRGGIYNAVGGITALVLFQFHDLTEGLKRVLPILALTGLFMMFVFPALDNFTGGKLQERFEDTETTSRTGIIQGDIAVFRENPFLGVGVGASSDYRREVMGFGVGSHTEFSRLISEHGLFGAIALLSLVVMTIINLMRQRSAFGRSLVAGISVWCFLFMANTGMRLAAPAFILGMAFMTIIGSRLPGRGLRGDFKRKNSARIS